MARKRELLTLARGGRREAGALKLSNASRGGWARGGREEERHSLARCRGGDGADLRDSGGWLDQESRRRSSCSVRRTTAAGAMVGSRWRQGRSCAREEVGRAALARRGDGAAGLELEAAALWRSWCGARKERPVRLMRAP